MSSGRNLTQRIYSKAMEKMHGMMETKAEDTLLTGKEVSDKIANAVKAFHADFKCLKCGICCESGVGVALWPHEFHRLKKLHAHIYRHIVMLGNWYALKLPCIFYNTKKKTCRIYDKRPIACKMYPLGVKPDGNTRVSLNCSSIKADKTIKLTTKEV